ncbi:F-box/kelch-repeat protein At3g18720-like [Raphanus sativus]|uniref:F-box/kelch-repeat protein At3g18720-like n=1 Tax=Raphanus sativus TaxID=3726 RepID=A0A9W3BUY3_RAPSA|nr:F-box/kelch-repeat protein At3g18720-like [Raphanus sativus]
MWNMNIPSDLLQEILSRLSLKANIQASTVCKTWREAAVSVRELQPHPWLFYPLKEPEEGNYILFDPSRSQTYKLNFPELQGYAFSYSRDGWLLVVTNIQKGAVPGLFFLFNPFTREHIYLPTLKPKSNVCLAFSAAPTSSRCLVISLNDSYSRTPSYILIDTCRPGETVWTTHRYKNKLPRGRWNDLKMYILYQFVKYYRR